MHSKARFKNKTNGNSNTHKLVVSKEHRLGSIYGRFSEHVTCSRHVATYSWTPGDMGYTILSREGGGKCQNVCAGTFLRSLIHPVPRQRVPPKTMKFEVAAVCNQDSIALFTKVTQHAPVSPSAPFFSLPPHGLVLGSPVETYPVFGICLSCSSQSLARENKHEIANTMALPLCGWLQHGTSFHLV